MTDFLLLLQQGHAWMFIPGAVVLGALHGLEPGHSKTMMAAFIIAIQGTVMQAVGLGLAATLSHTAVVWGVALLGLYVGHHGYNQTQAPYFQEVSAVIVIGVALWMLWSTRRHQQAVLPPHHHSSATKTIDTGHGVFRLEIVETTAASRFRVYAAQGQERFKTSNSLHLETVRPDGTRQSFSVVQRSGFLESREAIPEPHEFMVRLTLEHGQHRHDYDVEFLEDAHVPQTLSADKSGPPTETVSQDPHERAHATAIRQRFSGRSVTTGQILVFGLTGGLIPCPASVTVLLLCLQLQKVALGVTLVLCFSLGLALTMVASGVTAALMVQHVSRHWSGFDALSRRAPYFSGFLMLLFGVYMGYHGLQGLR